MTGPNRRWLVAALIAPLPALLLAGLPAALASGRVRTSGIDDLIAGVLLYGFGWIVAGLLLTAAFMPLVKWVDSADGTGTHHS